MDLYQLFDLMSVMCVFFDDVRYARFTDYTSLYPDIYVRNAKTGKYVPTGDNRLQNVRFSVMKADGGDWTPLTYNAFCELAAEETGDVFRLVAETAPAEDVQPTVFQLIGERIQASMQQVLKWIVGLLNALFNIISKLKK